MFTQYQIRLHKVTTTVRFARFTILFVSLFLLLFASPTTSNSATFSSGFADTKEETINVKPAVPMYKIEPWLANVTNRDYFGIPIKSGEMLAKNGFVVIPSEYDEFFQLYEENRYQSTPNFITTDSMLHTYHLIFDHILEKLETEKLAPELKILNQNMMTASLQQYEHFKGTSWEKAAKTNIGFFAVASKLLDPSVVVPAIVQNDVNAELQRIESHASMEESLIMGIKEDYTQYIPRGHYDKTELLKAYFKSMMWYGRLTFVLNKEDKAKSSALIAYTLMEKDNLARYERIYEPTCFFVGRSDDITIYQIGELLAKVYGKNQSWKNLNKDDKKFKNFFEMAKVLKGPKINSVPFFNNQSGEDRRVAGMGFRFMGQRYVVDAEIFQRLVAPAVDKRMLPMGLDIPTAMGSEEAMSILSSLGETDYPGYTANMGDLREFINKTTYEDWTQNLYWGWLYTIKPLTTDKPSGYPTFMLNQAWSRKELNTYLGNWTELKHDTILYGKQCYAECGGENDYTYLEDMDDRGYVEPNPELYSRLKLLCVMTSEGLENRKLLNEQDKKVLSILATLSGSLKTISEKELENRSLTEDEYELIRSFGAQLEHIWMECFKEEEGVSMLIILQDNPAALVADVATGPGGVLEEGTGKIDSVWVIVPVDGKLKLAKGGVYSYYEFVWEASDRLTDKKWRRIFEHFKTPEWTWSFKADDKIYREVKYLEEYYNLENFEYLLRDENE